MNLQTKFTILPKLSILLFLTPAPSQNVFLCTFPSFVTVFLSLPIFLINLYMNLPNYLPLSPSYSLSWQISFLLVKKNLLSLLMDFMLLTKLYLLFVLLTLLPILSILLLVLHPHLILHPLLLYHLLLPLPLPHLFPPLVYHLPLLVCRHLLSTTQIIQPPMQVLILLILPLLLPLLLIISPLIYKIPLLFLLSLQL